MDIDELQIVRLTQDYNLKEFDCGNPDLNEFLLNDAKDYQKGRRYSETDCPVVL